MSLFDLTGKTIVIVGGGGKLGQCWSKVLHEYGGDIIDDLDVKDGFDATTEKDVIDEFLWIADNFIECNVLIYAVMAKPENYYADCDDYPMETFRKVIDANLNGAYLCSREAKKYGCNNIIFISSVQGAESILSNVLSVILPPSGDLSVSLNTSPAGGHQR
jgi:NAD(P)-dependent dehydrogenase (short-subunit alcohol dehydrogenase family)